MSSTNLICQDAENTTNAASSSDGGLGYHIVCSNPLPQGARAAESAGKWKGKALWWSAGGTILSVLGFIALALFEQYNSYLGELRADLKHFNEVSGEFVKKERLRKCIDHVIECKKELETSRHSRAELERELTTMRKERDEMSRELQRLRERLATIEGRQNAPPVVLIPADHSGSKR